MTRRNYLFENQFTSHLQEQLDSCVKIETKKALIDFSNRRKTNELLRDIGEWPDGQSYGLYAEKINPVTIAIKLDSECLLTLTPYEFDDSVFLCSGGNAYGAKISFSGPSKDQGFASLFSIVIQAHTQGIAEMEAEAA